MKKLIFASLIVGIIGFGCSQKAVVQSEAPMQKTAPTVVESKPVVVTQPAQMRDSARKVVVVSALGSPTVTVPVPATAIALMFLEPPAARNLPVAGLNKYVHPPAA